MVLDQSVLDDICLRTFEGESMRSICRDPAMPSRSRVFKELVENPAFADQYARAREGLYQSWAEEILEISDDSTTDYVTKVGRNGHEYEAVDQEHIQRSRLRVDSRKWLLSKLLPKTFGDKVEHEHGGEVAVHHDVSSMSEKEKMRRFALFMLEDRAANGTTLPGVAEPVIRSHPADQPDEVDPGAYDESGDDDDQPDDDEELGL
jgi:hypothetical protein